MGIFFLFIIFEQCRWHLLHTYLIYAILENYSSKDYKLIPKEVPTTFSTSALRVDFPILCPENYFFHLGGQLISF